MYWKLFSSNMETILEMGNDVSDPSLSIIIINNNTEPYLDSCNVYFLLQNTFLLSISGQQVCQRGMWSKSNRPARSYRTKRTQKGRAGRPGLSMSVDN